MSPAEAARAALDPDAVATVRAAGGDAHRAVLHFRRERLPCAVGAAGIRAGKREGDHATPAGVFAIRRLLYRADRVPVPPGRLPRAPIGPEDGWCDDPSHPDYNRAVRLPHPARAERLWRADALYDLVGVLGFNDAPVEPGRGSAVFLHAAPPDGGPTEGCVGLAPDALRGLLAAGLAAIAVEAR